MLSYGLLGFESPGRGAVITTSQWGQTRDDANLPSSLTRALYVLARLPRQDKWIWTSKWVLLRTRGKEARCQPNGIAINNKLPLQKLNKEECRLGFHYI